MQVDVIDVPRGKPGCGQRLAHRADGAGAERIGEDMW